MKTGHWIVMTILAVALVVALALPQQGNASRPGIGKWGIYELNGDILVLINSEDGKTWVGSKSGSVIAWKKCERE